ncbi:single-stranded DNA-binding protein [Nocardiopsis sp. Huas11]|uniref:single-stranded DNA-binding protein n=1 Tax=Nocardiopsis sp. Huas11 TaxID=2183912 RepID=UPI000EACD6F4|nr:single-stranded DNA-binding protein [Nocardiopsis sp. Huas11]
MSEPAGSERAIGAGEDNGRREAAPEPDHLNEIVLVGRVTAEPSVRDLPSGDRLVTWRICVARPPDTRFRGRRVDSITCVSFDEGVRDEVRGWRLGDVVRLSGALRRRTWRGYDAVRSVHEVEVGGAALIRAVRPKRGAVRR